MRDILFPVNLIKRKKTTSPYDFYNNYKDLSVDYIQDNGSIKFFNGIAAKKYVINLPNNSKIVEISSAINKVLYAGNESIKKNPEKFTKNDISEIDSKAFSRVRFGKGSPFDMEHILKVGLISGAIKPTQEDLERFASNYFGVDCTGFVCAYFQTIGKMPLTEDPLNIGCRYFLNKAKLANQIIWNSLEILEGDVIVWMLENGQETRSPGHIALIQSVQTSTMEIDKSAKTFFTPVMNLYCAESNGAHGEDPRKTLRFLGEIGGNEKNHNRYWTLKSQSGKDGKVLIIRPFGYPNYRY